MTVQELIDALQLEDPESTIRIWDKLNHDDGQIVSIAPLPGDRDTLIIDVEF